MATQQQNIEIAVGEDSLQTLTMLNSDGSSTISISGLSMTFVASYPGGTEVVTLSTAAGSMTAGAPAPCNALLDFSSTMTVNLAPGYLDFQIRVINPGQNTETTTGTLVLTP